MLTQADKLARAREIYPLVKDTPLTCNLASILAARATDFTNEEAGAVKPFLPDWYPGMECKKDRLITYQGEVYRIGQDHTATDTYHPGDEGTTALYSHILLDEEDNEIWQEFDGVSGTYRYLQVVRDPDDWLLYRSTLQGTGNVWGPPHEQPAYWELVEGQNGIES